jgi:sigma-B regulation protein RsbU (phosphoserine phosphatase)
LAALLCVVYLVVVLIRVTLALPGSRAYERKVRELDAIYDFNLTAGSAFDPQELQAAVLESMFAVAEPDVAAIVEPGKEGPGCSCTLLRAEGSGKHVYRFDSRTSWAVLAERFADRRPAVIVDHRKTPPGALERIWEPVSGSSVIVPVITHEGAARAVLIAGRFETFAFDQGEVRSLAGFANQVALAMDHARLLRDTVEAERRQRELEIDREFQINLLPANPPQEPGVDIAARSDPATEVGGDVAGHGMRAGMLMAMAKSAIYTHGQSDESPTVLMERLNETLLHMSADNQFMTMVFFELDQNRRSYCYSNAGHHYPLHIRHDSGSVEELESNGLPLGMLPRAPGPFIERDLSPGDVLVFYTDGLVEAGEGAGEMFGVARLGEVVLANRSRDAKTVVEAVFRAVRKFSGNEPLADDATVVVVRAL